MAWSSILDRIVKWWHDLIFYASFSFTLINTFGAGTKWITRTLRLLVFVLMLLFPLMSKLYHYLTHDKILRQVSYGPEKRNSLDIYLVHSTKLGKDLCPVVVYIGGGGWTVGYRMWALLMEKIFTDQGVILLSVDYRNFPQGTISDMLTDVNRAISWTIDNVSKYGGDPENVHVMGQSAGAHLVIQAAIDQSAREVFVEARKNGMRSVLSSGSMSTLEAEVLKGGSPQLSISTSFEKKKNPSSLDPHVGGDQLSVPKAGTGSPSVGSADRSRKMALERSLALSYSKPPTSWNLKNIRSLILLSGPYDIASLIDHLHQRGLYRQVMYCIMEGELTHNSPYARIQRRSFLESGAAERLPAIYLLHGDVDETIPYQESEKMKLALEEAGAHCKIKIYKGKNHTDAVMEDMFSGDNTMLQDAVNLVLKGKEGFSADSDYTQTEEVDHWRIVLARYVNPF